jgi:hypothetical protein
MNIIFESTKILMEQDVVLELKSPIKICGGFLFNLISSIN